MLRKKLSKLIVAVMAAVMLSGGMSGVGQAVFANTSAEVVTTEARKTVNILETTKSDEVINHINDSTVSVLRVSGRIVIREDIAKALNARTTPLTIEVQVGSVLEIDNVIKLDGNNSKLKIVRGAGKQGALLETKSSISTRPVEATVTGVTFDNAGVESAVENKVNNKITLILDGNTLSNGGALSYTSTSDKNIYTNNNLGTGSLLKDQKMIEFSINSHIEGATTVTMSGSTTNYASIGTAIAGTTAATTVEGYVTLTITETDSTTGHVVKKNVPLDNSGRFSGEVISGLNPGKKYKVEAEAIYKDEKGNTYSRKFEKPYEFTTYNFSSSVTNVTNNSATITLNHGKLSTTSYPLTLRVFNGSTSVFEEKDIEHSTTLTSINVPGLASGTSYTYEIRDKANNVIDTGTFPTNSSTITGGGITGGGSTGGSVTSGDLTTNDINRADIKDVSVSIPVGNTTLANNLRDGRDYKTNIEGVTVTYSNGKVEFTGLVPEKDYRDLTITYTDKDGRIRTVKVSSFKTKASETKLRQFIVDVYRYSLDRVADERGFAYWEDQLKNKKTSPDEFVKNLLNEPEFINKHKTTTEKVEALYQVIVNRKSDSQGLSFWTKKYDDLVARGYSESMALRVIVDEMVNEQEFKNRVRDLAL